jgi:hypothetical protein
MEEINPFSNPRAMAKAGERIYASKFKEELERNHFGKFAAINVSKKTVEIGETSEEAISKAVAKEPGGIFHLIRIGSSGAYQVSYSYREAGPDWIF